MKNILFSVMSALLLVAVAQQATAQKAWLEPGGTDFNPEEPAYIYVDLNQCECGSDCSRLINYPDDLFLWTWKPSENATVNNGSWNSSNEDMKVEKMGDGKVRFQLTATTFYNVNAAKVYSEGIHFLIKAKDGADQGGLGEMKTEDLKITPEAPGAPKVFTMPSVPKSLRKTPDTTNPDTLATAQNDYITFFYNNRLEENPLLQNLPDGTELHVFLRITGSDNKDYLNSKAATLGTDTRSKMKSKGNGMYTYTFRTDELFATCGNGAAFTLPPAGTRATNLRLQIAKADPAAPNPSAAGNGLANGTFLYYIGKCD